MTAHAYYVVGDVRAVLDALPDGSIDLVLSSWPFLRVRDYLPADHPDKSMEIGTEANPAAYIDTCLEVTAALRPKLTEWGSLVMEHGDTMSGAGGGDLAGGTWGSDDRVGGRVKGAGWGGDPTPEGWPLAKSLACVPELYRVALAYGLNPLTGAPSPAGRWRVRNRVIWGRPNPTTADEGDKFRRATSDLAVATLSERRWFDMHAVRQPVLDPEKRGGEPRRATFPRPNGSGDGAGVDRERVSNPAGAPPHDHHELIEAILTGAPAGLTARQLASHVRAVLDGLYGPGDLWEHPTRGYRGAHYAVWPPHLLPRPIQAMCPRRVCRACAAPSRRIVERTQVTTRPGDNGPQSIDRRHEAPGFPARTESRSDTTAWTTCGCPGTDGLSIDGFHTGAGWRRGRVLDPFGGTGTTGMVATGLGRDALLIDLDERNLALAADRLGLFLTEVETGDLPDLLTTTTETR